MKVVVTGAAGRIGRAAVAELAAHGHDVLGTDRIHPPEPSCRFLTAELADAGAAFDLVHGADWVLHLGAIPGPGAQTQPSTFHNNVASTYNVLEAAAALKVGRVVFASTVFALGWHPEPDTYWPRYVPVDEDHRLTPFEAYGLSKQVGEDICAAASRRAGMPIVSLRIMNVIAGDGYRSFPWTPPTRESGVRFVMWPYVDLRDVARACRLALEAETRGHEAVFIAANDTRFDRPTAALLREVAPPGIDIRSTLDDSGSVVSNRKAAELIGFQPQHAWRDEVARGASGPRV